MHQALAMKAFGNACFLEQPDRALLEHAGANAALDIVARSRLEDHAVDAVDLQQTRKQQPRRACADDADLGALLRCHVRGAPRRY
jgi:hypothetical protein